MASPDPRRERRLLAVALVAVFAISAVTDLRLLGLAWGAAALLLRRGLARALGRVLRAVVPVTVALAAVSYGWLHLTGRSPAVSVGTSKSYCS